MTTFPLTSVSFQVDLLLFKTSFEGSSSILLLTSTRIDIFFLYYAITVNNFTAITDGLYFIFKELKSKMQVYIKFLTNIKGKASS